MKKFIIPILILTAVVFFTGAHFLKTKAKQKLSGTLEMTEHSLGASVPGRIAAVNVEEGKSVKRGERIATLDHYEQVKKDYDRLTDLAKTGGVDNQTVEHALLQMKDHEVLSPVDGIVLVKVREAGEVLGAGQTIAIVGDPSDQWVRVFVPEGKINQIKLGQQARLKFDGMKESVSGVVSYISPKAEFTPRNIQTAEERVTQTFAVKIKLQNALMQVHPGVSADVEL